MATNPRYANGHRRRQLRARVLATETHCAWEHCPRPETPIDKTLHHHDPWAGEVDEIIPISRGGNPLSRGNVRLLHRWCNQHRGDGTREPTTTTPAGWPTSTQW
jgi:hypothetical protein